LDECEVTEIRRRQEWLIPFLDGFEDIILENNCTISQVEPRWNEHGIVHEAWAIQKLKFSAKPDPEEKTDDEDSFYTDKKEEYGLRNRWTKIDDITPLLG
jgi:hypothetical protein